MLPTFHVTVKELRIAFRCASGGVRGTHVAIDRVPDGGVSGGVCGANRSIPGGARHRESKSCTSRRDDTATHPTKRARHRRESRTSRRDVTYHHSPPQKGLAQAKDFGRHVVLVGIGP